MKKVILLALIVCLWACRVDAAWSVTSNSNGIDSGVGGSGTLTITAPASIADGDLLLAGIAASSFGGGSISPPAGWTTNVSEFTGSGGSQLAIFSKIAASESGDYSFTGQRFMSGTVLRIRGTGTLSVDTSGTGQGGTGTTATALGVTASQAHDLIAYFGGSDAASGALGVPSGYTDTGGINCAGNREGSRSGWEDQTASGASGDKTATTQTPWSAVLIAVKDVSGGATARPCIIGGGLISLKCPGDN